MRFLSALQFSTIHFDHHSIQSIKFIDPRIRGMMNSADKQKLLGQKGLVVWFTGLSGSGKTTLSTHLEQALHTEGVLTQSLDGDLLRSGLCRDLGFLPEDRAENIRRVSEVAKLSLDTGLVVLCAFISPNEAVRSTAKSIVGRDHFFEVYLNTPLETCEERDVKGLYKKARSGEIKDFTGVDAVYESPESPDVILDTTHISVEEAVQLLLKQVMKKVKN